MQAVVRGAPAAPRPLGSALSSASSVAPSSQAACRAPPARASPLGRPLCPPLPAPPAPLEPPPRANAHSPSESVMSSSARPYSCGTSALRPVRLNRSRIYSSSTSEKYSLPLVERNHVIQLRARRQKGSEGGRSGLPSREGNGEGAGRRGKGQARPAERLAARHSRRQEGTRTSWSSRTRSRSRGRPWSWLASCCAGEGEGECGRTKGGAGKGRARVWRSGGRPSAAGQLDRQADDDERQPHLDDTDPPDPVPVRPRCSCADDPRLCADDPVARGRGHWPPRRR